MIPGVDPIAERERCVDLVGVQPGAIDHVDELRSKAIGRSHVTHTVPDREGGDAGSGADDGLDGRLGREGGDGNDTDSDDDDSGDPPANGREPVAGWLLVEEC